MPVMTMEPQQLVDALEWRYAVKAFDPSRQISPAQWEALEKALLLSPSSYGLQPYRFIDVKDPAVRKKLTPVSWNQAQVETASHFVVFAARTDLTEEMVDRFISLTAEKRGIPPESLAAYRRMMVQDLVKGPRHAVVADWAARQVYIALGNLMTSAALLGVDTCPMEGINPDAYDEILGLKGSGFKTVCACALGTRSAEDKYQFAKKVRFGREELVQEIG